MPVHDRVAPLGPMPGCIHVPNVASRPTERTYPSEMPVASLNRHVRGVAVGGLRWWAHVEWIQGQRPMWREHDAKLASVWRRDSEDASWVPLLPRTP